MNDTLTKGPTKRINNAKGHWYKLDGDKVDGVTTVIGAGVPKPALTYWAANAVAEYAANHFDLLAGMEPAERYDLMKGAPWRDRDKAAKRGTEVHGYAERIINGEEVEVPEELLGHVDSYMRFLEEWSVDPLHVEITVVNRKHRYMGSLDLIANLDGLGLGLWDIKTTRSGIYAETALQIAAYRHAETYLGADGVEQPMPHVDICGAIWVRSDGYDLIPLDCGPATFRTFLYAKEIARFANEGKALVGDALTPPQRNAA